MRILLQQKDTGLYLKDNNAWVAASTEATDFVSSTAAIEFCEANNLTGLQLVLKFEEQKCDIVMAITPPAEAPRPRATS